MKNGNLMAVWYTLVRPDSGYQQKSSLEQSSSDSAEANSNIRRIDIRKYPECYVTGLEKRLIFKAYVLDKIFICFAFFLNLITTKSKRTQKL